MAAVRVRYAPSPTGFLHIGGARTALFNWLFARRHGGVFVVRVEDTDVDRSREDLVAPLLDGLRWLGLDWDEGPGVGGPHGPYFQSQRLELYQAEARRLLEAGRAYRCYCTVEELEAMRQEARRRGEASFRYPGRCRDLSPAECAAREREGRVPVIRFKAPGRGETVVQDLIHGEVRFDHQVIDDFILIKSDGTPTYNFAAVVDDHAMRITHVIRGDDHLSNTPRQVLLCEALGYPVPRFAHVPLILGPDRSKLSKRRHGDLVAVDTFRQRGFFPEAVRNYLALLGWSPGDGREILSTEELIEAFDLGRVHKAAAVYDVEKMAWMNGHYMRTLPLDRVAGEALPRLVAAGLVREPLGEAERAYVWRVVDLVRQRVRTLEELVEASRYFFADVDGYDPEGVRKRFGRPGVAEVLEAARAALERVEPFEAPRIEQAFRDLCQRLGIGTGELFHPVRLAVTGRTVGPGLFELMELVGRERCLERIDRAVAFIRAGHAAKVP